MKKACLLLLVIIGLYPACKKDATKSVVKVKDTVIAVNHDTSKVIFKIPDTVLSNYNKSYNSWLSYKQQCNNSYSFIMKAAYVEPSIFTIITSKVQNGVVTARDFSAYHFIIDTVHNTATADTTLKWHEEGNTLNTHQEAGLAMTLDDIYQMAKSTWLNVDPSKHTFYFETKNSGLISECGSYLNGCQDNCFYGIQNISSITSP